MQYAGNEEAGSMTGLTRCGSGLEGVADASSCTSRGALWRAVRCSSRTFLRCRLASQTPSIGFQYIPSLWEVHAFVAKYLHQIQSKAQTLMIPNNDSAEDTHPTLQRETGVLECLLLKLFGEGKLAGTQGGLSRVPKLPFRA